MSAHTAGPWEAEYGADGYYLVSDGDGVELYRDTKANARLIAAAPELLDALIALLPDFTGGLDPYETEPVVKARAAVAKALAA